MGQIPLYRLMDTDFLLPVNYIVFDSTLFAQTLIAGVH
jgi:hypothetical protein